jgi:hypothetical protein
VALLLKINLRREQMTDQLIKDFIDKLGNNDFVRKQTLINIGLFGSMVGVDKALKAGLIPYIKVSPNRTLVLRAGVVEYIKRSLKCEVEELCQK